MTFLNNFNLKLVNKPRLIVVRKKNSVCEILLEQRDEQKQHHIGRKRQHLCTQHNTTQHNTTTHNHNYHTTHYTPTPITHIYHTERLHALCNWYSLYWSTQITRHKNMV